jgi:hypothetical protein
MFDDVLHFVIKRSRRDRYLDLDQHHVSLAQHAAVIEALADERVRREVAERVVRDLMRSASEFAADLRFQKRSLRRSSVDDDD